MLRPGLGDPGWVLAAGAAGLRQFQAVCMTDWLCWEMLGSFMGTPGMGTKRGSKLVL